MSQMSLLHRLKLHSQTDTRKALMTLIILIGLVLLAAILSKEKILLLKLMMATMELTLKISFRILDLKKSHPW